MPNFERYSKLHDEIMRRLEVGEITTEQAKEVNDLVFEKYIIERDNDNTEIKKSKFNFNSVPVDIDTAASDIDTDLKPYLDILNKKWSKIILEASKWCVDHAKNWKMPDDLSTYKSKLKLSEICFCGKNKKYFLLSFNGPSNLDGGDFFDGHRLYMNANLEDNDVSITDISI